MPSLDSLDYIVTEYHNGWPHRALRTRFQKKTTPAEVWATLPRWEGKEDLELIYDDEN
jgi:hypothetical protein